MIAPFVPFSREHGIALAIGVLMVAGFVIAGRKGGAAERRTTGLLAFLNFAAFPLSLIAWLSLNREKSLENLLPLQLCDIAAITAGCALVWRSPVMAGLTYFWGLAATAQALVTPAIDVGFPQWPFLMFFVHHFAVVTAAIYLPWVLGWRPPQPWWRGPLHAYLAAVIYMGCAMLINFALGTNFAFLSHPPPNPSLIDQLGPWPWYLVSFQFLALGLFLVLGLPFVRSQGKNGGFSRR